MKQKVVDLSYLNWNKTRSSSGTTGTLLKAYETVNGKKYYYKLSNYDSYQGIIGHECINEVIVSRLLNILGISHVNYELLYAKISIDNKIYKTWICKSEDFKTNSENKIALDLYYQINHLNDESPLAFCIRNCLEKEIYEMIVVDYLILNRDRHGANIELLKNNKTGEIKMAPLFDHGMSLYCTCNNYKDSLKQDYLEDRKVQSFIGSNSTYKNLSLIPIKKYPKLNELKLEHKEEIIDGLDQAMDSLWLNRIFEMIYERYKTYENIRNKR